MVYLDDGIPFTQVEAVPSQQPLKDTQPYYAPSIQSTLPTQVEDTQLSQVDEKTPAAASQVTVDDKTPAASAPAAAAQVTAQVTDDRKAAAAKDHPVTEDPASPAAPTQVTGENAEYQVGERVQIHYNKVVFLNATVSKV